LHGTAFARKGAKEVYLCCKKWLLRRSVYSHKNLITELEVFSKDFHKESGKILPQSGKRIDSRTPPPTLGNSSRLGLFRPNLEEIPLVYGYL
jgi:hypothetical protein